MRKQQQTFTLRFRQTCSQLFGTHHDQPAGTEGERDRGTLVAGRGSNPSAAFTSDLTPGPTADFIDENSEPWVKPWAVPSTSPQGTGKAGLPDLPPQETSPHPPHCQTQSWESSWCCHVLFPTRSAPTLATMLSAQGPAWKDHINELPESLGHNQRAVGSRSQESGGRWRGQ